MVSQMEHLDQNQTEPPISRWRDEEDEEAPLLHSEGEEQQIGERFMGIIWPLSSRRALAGRWAVLAKNRTTAIIAGAIVSFFLTVVTLLVLHTVAVIQDSANVLVSRLEIINVTQSGVTLGVKGTISMEYWRTRWVLKPLFYPLAYAIGEMDITPSSPVEVYVNLPQFPDERFYKPARVTMEQITMDFTPGSINGFEFPIHVEINPLDVTKLYNQYLTLKDIQHLPVVQVSGVFQTTFHLEKYFFLGDYSAQIRHELIFRSNDTSYIPGYVVNSYALNADADSITTMAQLTLEPINIPLCATIGQIEWDIYIPACEKNLLYISSLTTNQVEFRSGQKTLLNAIASVPKFATKLEKTCPDGFSPVNRFVKKLTGAGANIFVRARRKSTINSELPPWLHRLLSDSFQPVSLNLDEFFDPAPLAYRVESGGVMISNDAESLPKLDMQLDAFLDLPFQNNENKMFDLQKVSGDICLLYEDEIMLKVYLYSWQDVQTNGSSLDLSIRSAKIDIIDDKVVSRALGRYLNGDRFEVLAKAEIDIDIKTPVSTRIFQQLEKDAFISTQGTEDGLQDIEIDLHDLIYITSSTSDQLGLFVNMGVTNPFKMTAGLQFVNVKVEYNGTLIGNVELADAVLTAEVPSNVTSVLRLEADNEEVREAIGRMVSEYISGQEPGIVIHGHPGSSKLPAFTNILSRLSIPFKLPSFQNGEHTGFIISTIFHVLSSEVEVTFFNPLTNEPALVQISDAKVFAKDVLLANIYKQPLMSIPPGISTSQKIPVTIAKGAARDILRRAIDGHLTLCSVANFDLTIGKFPLSLRYEGEGVYSEIKL